MARLKEEMMWLILPLVYGWVNVYVIFPPLISQMLMEVFWFWVGMKCAGQKRAIKRCLFTNSLWGISLIIFIWQFILLSDESRNLPLALFSQLYIQGFIWMGTKISGLLFDVDHGTVIHILAYISMLGVFLLGAAYQKLHERKI